MNTGCVVGLVTCGSRQEARKLAGVVLDQKLAACVSIVDSVESHYWWQGKKETSKECLLMIKTTKSKAGKLTRVLKGAHSYETPEIIFAVISAGEGRYLKWIKSSVAGMLMLFAGLSNVSADTIDDLTKQLGHVEEDMRAEAADKLVSIGGPRVEKLFREMLSSSNPERRQMAVVGILQISDDEADVQRVRERLKDESATVRWSAAVALGNTGRQEAVAWLDAAARSDESEMVREGAAEALAKLKSRIFWVRTMPDALKAARAERKPVMTYFFIRNSAQCEKFEEGVLGAADVVEAARAFLCVRLDAAQNVEQTRKFDVRGAPSVLLLDSAGNEIGRVTGLADKATMLSRMAEAQSGALTLREARQRAAGNPGDVAANWKVAQSYLDEGREDLAEPHLRNVIAYDDANRRGHTDSAMFALGFCLGKRGRHAAAAYCMETFLERWPNHKNREQALYCMGLSQAASGKKDQGRATLERLLREYPNGVTAVAARQTLEKLDADKSGN
jgi:periplasmic divalent cation tolerance protein